MKIVKETLTDIVYLDYFEGNPVHFMKNKQTGEISINADDAIRAMGYDGTFNDYLGTDEGLDFICEWKKNNPDMPFWGGAVKRKTIQYTVYTIYCIFHIIYLYNIFIISIL